MLNEYTEKTKGVIHLLVTSLCDRNCKYCCNKQYDLSDIPQVSPLELKEAHTVCLTGGEPFKYSNPSAIAGWLKAQYKNLKNIYVYTNAFELMEYVANQHGQFHYIDGLSISIKNRSDLDAMLYLVREKMWKFVPMASTRLYIFKDDVYKNINKDEIDEKFKRLMADLPPKFSVSYREWQKEFIPADDSVFRRI